MIRCLPLREGFKVQVSLVDTVGGTTFAVPVVVGGIEQLRLHRQVTGLEPATFEVYRVALLGGRQRAWYTVAAPHILLRYDNGQRACELRDYSPGTRGG